MKILTNLTKVFLLVFLLGSAFSVNAQGNPDDGKKLFRNYCASCHSKDMKKDMTGPALGGAQERWGNDEDLYSWIRNSQAMIAAGHPRATELWDKWGTIMTSFPNLTDDEILSILAYVNGTYDGTYGAKVNGPNPPESTGGEVVESNGFSKWLYVGLLAFLGLLALVLARVISSLNAVAAKKADPNAIVERKSIWQLLTSKAIIGFLIFAFILMAGYFTVKNATNLGRQQGYAPEQPIKFSHETHAGVNGIDCQYCHDGARRSKHSVIPAMNTCMNCHKAINYGSTYGTAELTKIYVSTGYNPITNKYIKDYENFPEDSVAIVYKNWMEKAIIENDDKYEVPGDELSALVDDQWKDIVASLTNETKKSVKGAVEWVRIHNLPDHVYFNHAQHVTAGKVDCEQCHGKVQEMKVLKQMSPLSMGWCVNCHRETDVNFKDNAYYNAYEDYHKELKNGDRTSVKVEDIGGLECQKCHY